MTALLHAMKPDSGHAETAWKMICNYYDYRAKEVPVDQALEWAELTDSAAFHDATLERYVKNRDDLSIADLTRIRAVLKENRYESKVVLEKAMAQALERDK